MTPDQWLTKWKMVELQPNWKILDKRGNGYLFRGAYLDFITDEDTGQLFDKDPTLAVLATIERHHGDRWAWISYTASDRIVGPRTPNPKEATMVRQLFAGKGAKIAPPPGFAISFMSPLSKNYFLNIDERRE
jgi:hypothetical protein